MQINVFRNKLPNKPSKNLQKDIFLIFKITHDYDPSELLKEISNILQLFFLESKDTIVKRKFNQSEYPILFEYCTTKYDIQSGAVDINKVLLSLSGYDVLSNYSIEISKENDLVFTNKKILEILNKAGIGSPAEVFSLHQLTR
jgi:hypothetical protein